MRFVVAAMTVIAVCVGADAEVLAQTPNFTIQTIEINTPAGVEIRATSAYRLDNKSGNAWLCVAFYNLKTKSFDNSTCIALQDDEKRQLDPKLGPFVASIPAAPAIDRYPAYWLINERTGTTYACSGGSPRSCIQPKMEELR